LSGWELDCDCCKKRIKKIKTVAGEYENYNLDDTIHEKHYKIWAQSVASFLHYPLAYEKLNPESKIGELTVSELERFLEGKLNLKFGTYYHGQSEYDEVWLAPRKLTFDGIDYFIAGNIDGNVNGVLIELKTTWVTAKYKIQSVIDKAKIQADIYAWIGGFQKAEIIVKNLAKPKLSTTISYEPDTLDVKANLLNYIEKNKHLIKKY